MTKEKADRAGVFFFWLLAHLGFYLVGRELTDLRRQPTHCVHWFIPRVHELAARAMRGKCVRHRAELKSAMSRFPRFRLYHACEHSARKSRADSCTHCSARPLKVQGGRGSSACADGMKSAFFLLAIGYIRVLCGRSAIMFR